jgi:hypothetical protein
VACYRSHRPHNPVQRRSLHCTDESNALMHTCIPSESRHPFQCITREKWPPAAVARTPERVKHPITGYSKTREQGYTLTSFSDNYSPWSLAMISTRSCDHTPTHLRRRHPAGSEQPPAIHPACKRTYKRKHNTDAQMRTFHAQAARSKAKLRCAPSGRAAAT